MHDDEPPVRGGGPAAPRGRHLSSSAAVHAPLAHELLGEGRPGDAVGPHPAPGRAVLGRREAPRRGSTRDRRTPPRGPTQQPPARVGLAPVGARGLLVERQPPRPGPARPGTTRRRRSRRRGRRPPRPAGRPGASRRSAATGSVTCWSTWWACTTSNESSGRRARTRRRRRSPPPRRAAPQPAPVGRAPRRWPRGAVTRPGATRSARSTVMVPGPQPTSSRSSPGAQVRQEVGGRVRRRPPPVRAQHGLGVAVGVPGHPVTVADGGVARQGAARSATRHGPEGGRPWRSVPVR